MPRPRLPMALEQMQNLSVSHGVAASGLQGRRVADELEHERVGQFLAVEVRNVRGLELGEVEALGGDAGLVVDVASLGGGEGEVAGFVDGDDAAFP